MPKRVSKATVTVTPGQNAKVNNVIKFEDLLQNVKRGPAMASRKLAAGRAAERGQLGAIQTLAADLEDRLRALRAAMPDQAGSASPRPAKRRPRKA